LKSFIAIALLFCAVGAFAQTANNTALLSAESKKLKEWGHDPVIVNAVKEQNAKKTKLADIQAIDKKWMANQDTESAAILANACSKHLRDLISKNPNYSETFVMDDQGANVCMSARTSDYWQGDEAKWKNSFNGGKGAIFTDERKYDSSANAVLAQVSVPVYDGSKVIGAITIGVKVDNLK
jgi:hypothetical protein